MSTILLSFFFSSRRRHTRSLRDWSSDVCSSDLSAKVITSAAIIMVVVFAIFATTGVPQVKEIGLGLAVAIALDATLVRLVLVPATMELMGDWNWWVPKWLDKRLPDADFESDHIAEEERTAKAVV